MVKLIPKDKGEGQIGSNDLFSINCTLSLKQMVYQEVACPQKTIANVENRVSSMGGMIMDF